VLTLQIGATIIGQRTPRVPPSQKVEGGVPQRFDSSCDGPRHFDDNQLTTNEDIMNRELYKTVTAVENKLQEARGELSRFEHEFPTDSIEHQLIVELLERLDEASDPDVIAENVREYSDEYGVDCIEVFPGKIVPLED
jgi:hypothetical protein